MKHATNGFTLIEVMMVVAVILIVGAIALPVANGVSGQAQVKHMAHDYQCIAGFKFTRNGQTQIINSENGGIRCDELR